MTKILSNFKNKNLDIYIFVPVIFLIIVGIFGVFSVSMRIDNKYDLLIKKHLIFCVFGLTIIYLFSKLSLKNLIMISILIFTCSILLSISTIFFFSRN